MFTYIPFDWCSEYTFVEPKAVPKHSGKPPVKTSPRKSARQSAKRGF